MKREAASLKREAASLKREAGSLKREASSLKREAGSLKREAASLKREASSLKREGGRLKRCSTIATNHRSTTYSWGWSWTTSVAGSLRLRSMWTDMSWLPSLAHVRVVARRMGRQAPPGDTASYYVYERVLQKRG